MSAPTPSPLVLASASPRRREILELLRVPFRILPSGADETRLEGEDPRAYAVRAARDKAAEVASRLEGEDPPPFVLGADTVVIVEDDALVKPADDAEARSMLTRLSGRTHEVGSALALARAGEGLLDSALVITRVRFRTLSPEEIAGYVASGEGRDKAGSYAVQGLGAGLVESIDGSYHNVVGLPAAETISLLRRHGALGEWP